MSTEKIDQTAAADVAMKVDEAEVKPVEAEVAPVALPEALVGKTDDEIKDVKQKIVEQREYEF